MTEPQEDPVAAKVSAAVDAWLRWLPGWAPGTHRGRSRMCRRCTGSPFLVAAGLEGDAPHQVVHALVSRMQRIIDRAVDDYTEHELPTLHAELTGEQLWNAGGFDPGLGSNQSTRASTSTLKQTTNSRFFSPWPNLPSRRNPSRRCRGRR